MSLGEAFVNVNPSATGFATDLVRLLRAELVKVEAKVPGIKLRVQRQFLANEVQSAIRAAIIAARFAPLKIPVNQAILKRDVQASARAAVREANLALADNGLVVAVNGTRLSRDVQAAIRLALRSARFPTLRIQVNGDGLRDEVQAAIRAALRSSTFPALHITVDQVRLQRELQADVRRALHGITFSPIHVPIIVVLRGVAEARAALGSLGSAGAAAGARASGGISQIGRAARRLRGSLIPVAAGFAATAAAATFFGLKQASILDQLNKAYNALQNNAEGIDNALGQNKLLIRLRGIAEQTSFAFDGAAKLGQQLLGIGQAVPALELTNDRIAEVVQTVADAGAAVGATPAQISNLAVVLGKTAGGAKLTARELNSVALAIPTATRNSVFAQLARDLGLVEKNAKAGSKEMVAAISEVTDLQKRGLISGPQGFQALVQVLHDLPGAAGASARQLGTLAGALTSIKEKIQNRLADTFVGASVTIANALNDKKINKAITNLTTKVGAASAQLVTRLIPVLTAALPVIGNVFSAISNALVAVTPALLVVTRGVGDFIDGLRGSNAAAFFGGLGDAVKPVAFVILELVKAALQFGPVFAGIGSALSGLGLILTPIAAVMAAIANGIGIIAGSGAGEVIGSLAGAFAVAAGAAFLMNTALFASVAASVASVFSLGILNAVVYGTGGAFLALNAAILANPFIAAAAAVTFIVVAFTQFSAVANIAAGAIILVGSAIALAMSINPVVAIIAAVAGLVLVVKGLYDRFETVRQIVATVANVITTGLAVAFVVLIDTVQIWAVSILSYFKVVLQGLAHLPDWLGGGLANNAADFVQGLINGVNRVADQANAAIGRIQKSVQISVTVTTTEVRQVITKETRQAATNAFGGSGFSIATGPNPNSGGLGVRTGLSTTTQKNIAASNEKYAAQAGARIGQANAAAINKALAGLGAGGGGAGKRAGKAAKSDAEKAADQVKAAAAAAAKKLKADLAAIGRSIGIGFIASIATGSREEINTKLVNLQKAISSAFEKVKTNVDDKLIKGIAATNGRLGALADQRDALVAKIKEANEKAVSIAANLVSAESLSNLGLDTVGKGRDKDGPAVAAANAAAFDQKLKDRLAKLRKFAADIARLVSAGLDKNIIARLAEGGVESQGGIAAALVAGDPATIKSINATQKAIEAAAGGIGNTTADVLFDAGKNAGKGFLTGLIDQKAAIIKEMESIAAAMVASIKKALKIKSPSEVLRRLGRFGGKGLEEGLGDSVGGVAAAARKMARAAIPQLSRPSLGALQGAASASALQQLRSSVTNNGGNTFEIQVNGVSDPMAARQAGLAVAAPIADILQRRQDAAALAGTG